ncbi:MAG: hypothetical protein V4663_05020 [Bacteroidota bacterium]
MQFAPLTTYNYHGGSVAGVYLTERIGANKLILVIKGNELYLPVLDFLQKQVRGNGVYWRGESNFNEFGIINPNLLSSVKIRDTVVVQEYLIKLVRQN